MPLDELARTIEMLALAAGAVAAFATILEKVRRHDRSIDNFGQRIEKLERRQDVVDNELSRPHHLGGKPP